MPYRMTTVRDFRARQQNRPATSIVAITSAQPAERKRNSKAESVTMPLLLENAPHAFLAHDGSLEKLRKSFRLKPTAALEMVLAGLCIAVTGPTRRRSA